MADPISRSNSGLVDPLRSPPAEPSRPRGPRAPGDGFEARGTRTWSAFSGGAAATATRVGAPTSPTAANPTEAADTDDRLVRGDRGEAVAVLQERLTRHGYFTVADGVFGPDTEAALRRFQDDYGLRINGEADDATRAALASPRALRRGSSGEPVKAVQARLNRHGADLAEDGVFGPQTEAALKDFQADKGLRPTGVVSPETRAALDRGPDFRWNDPSTWLSGVGNVVDDLWREGGEFVDDVGTVLDGGWEAFVEKKKEDLQPVVDALSQDLEEPIRSLQPGDEFTFDNRAILRGGGASDVIPLLGLAAGKVATEAQIKVTRNADGGYTVRRNQLDLQAWSGEVDLNKVGKGRKRREDEESGPFGASGKAELGRERLRADEFTFDNPEDAARAARLLNRDALAEYLPVDDLSARDRRWLEDHRSAAERGSQVHSRLALEGKAWFLKAEGRGEFNPGQKIRYQAPRRDDRGRIVEPGRLEQIDYKWIELTGKQAAELGVKSFKGTGGSLPDLVLVRIEERRVFATNETVPADATYDDLRALIPDRAPEQVILRKKSWTGQTAGDWLEGQPDRVVEEEVLTFDDPQRTYFPNRTRYRWSDYRDVAETSGAAYTRTVAEPQRESVDVRGPNRSNTDQGESIRIELSGSPFGLLYYSLRYEGQAVIARRNVTDSERLNTP